MDMTDASMVDGTLLHSIFLSPEGAFHGPVRRHFKRDFRAVFIEKRSTNVDNDPCPDGHFKFPHLWPVKFLQAGRVNYRFIGGREFGLLS